MRSLTFILPALMVGACAAPAPEFAPTAQAAPFTVPMDPGTISCGDLSNPMARQAAVDWAQGQARAAVLAGRREAVPEPAALSSDLAAACDSAPSGTVRAALRQMGV